MILSKFVILHGKKTNVDIIQYLTRKVIQFSKSPKCLNQKLNIYLKEEVKDMRQL